jgi:hypothetical protein
MNSNNYLVLALKLTSRLNLVLNSHSFDYQHEIMRFQDNIKTN